MRGLLLAALTLLVAPAAMAVHYRGTTLSSDRTKLVLHTDRGEVPAPRTDKGQQGFTGPHVSPHGGLAGAGALAGKRRSHTRRIGDLP